MMPPLLIQWWANRRLRTRMILTTGTVLFLSGALLLYSSVQSAANNYQHQLDAQLKDELSAFAPLLIEQAIIGDYANIHDMLMLWVKRKDMMLAAWTDNNGKRVEALDKYLPPQTPEWFANWVNIPSVAADLNLELGGEKYGTLTMVLTAAPKIHQIWQTFLQQLFIILGGFLTILLLTLQLLRRGLAPLQTLAQGAALFGQGNHAVRLPPVAIPDILPSIHAFNQMAQDIESMLEQAINYNSELKESESRWRFALEGSGDGVWDWDLTTGALQLSRQGKEMLGYREDEIGNHINDLLKLIHKDDVQQIQENIEMILDGNTFPPANEFRMQCKDGSYKWILTRGMIARRDENNKPLRVIGTNTDITERKLGEEIIQHQANFDQLTQLPNRRLFYDRLQQEIKKVERKGLPIVLLLIDLDHFKDVNDTLGHDMGDILLKEAAIRLKKCVRDTDTVARLGGDEFTVILTEQHEFASIERIVQEILYQLSLPFELQDNVTYITASIGITLYPEDAGSIDALLKNADQAMYAAKHQGRNRFSYFTPSMQKKAQTHMLLSRDLRCALNNKEFQIHYQPIVKLADGKICKAEALIRWQHPTRGLINPAEFIPITEENGLIIGIGDWVFREAAKQAARWRISHHPKFQISVNVSPIQFHNSGINYKSWFEHLRSLDLSGQSIVIEITEGLLLDAHKDITNQLLAFRDAGIGVSIDDFGTGYSSLSYLKKFDIDYLKIDQSFVRNLTAGSDDLILCEAIIGMAHKLGLKVVAEGVETTHQRELLTAAGCDYGQGYLFSRAIPAEEFDRLPPAI